MSAHARFTILFVLGVLLFDTLGSIASRAMDFDYSILAVGSWLIYTAAGWFGAQAGGTIRAGLLTALVTAAFDATAGWAISWSIGPGRPDEPMGYADVVFAMTGVLVFALVAGGLGAILRKVMFGLGPRTA